MRAGYFSGGWSDNAARTLFCRRTASLGILLTGLSMANPDYGSDNCEIGVVVYGNELAPALLLSAIMQKLPVRCKTRNHFSEKPIYQKCCRVVDVVQLALVGIILPCP